MGFYFIKASKQKQQFICLLHGRGCKVLTMRVCHMLFGYCEGLFRGKFRLTASGVLVYLISAHHNSNGL